MPQQERARLNLYLTSEQIQALHYQFMRSVIHGDPLLATMEINLSKCFGEPGFDPPEKHVLELQISNVSAENGKTVSIKI